MPEALRSRARRTLRAGGRLVAPFVLALAAHPAAAGCSRPIAVPATPVGRLVIVDRDEVSGALPHLLREIGARADCEFTFRYVPRARAEHLAFNEQVGDLYMPAMRKPERDETHQYVTLFREGLAVVTPLPAPALPDRLADIESRPDLRGVFVRGFQLGPRYSAFVDRAVAEHRAYVVTDGPAMGRMLLAGRAAFTLISWVGGQGALEPQDRPSDAPASFKLTLLQDVTFEATGIYLSRRNLSEDDRILLQHAIEAAVVDGTVRRIFTQHYAPEVIDRAQWRLE